jgi:hypothetical protein
MKKISFGMALVSAAFLTACDKDDDASPPVPLEAKTAADINARPADNGGFSTYFNLTTGQVVPASDSNTTNWDIAFRSTTIKVNSGNSGPGAAAAQVLTTGFDDLKEAPESGYKLDTSGFAIPTGSNNGWYTYTGAAPTGAQHAILPIAGRTIVVKTANNKYAKIQIVSYYKGNPNTSSDEFMNLATRPQDGTYTIRYMIQADGSRKLE